MKNNFKNVHYPFNFWYYFEENTKEPIIEKEKDYPCIFSSESILNITSSIIKEPNYSGALYLQKAAQAKVENSIIDSLYLYNQSKIDVGNTSRIVESIIIEDHSALTGETLLLDGRDNGKINIFAKGESNIKLDWIGLAFESSPNIKIEDNIEKEDNIKNAEELTTTAQKLLQSVENTLIYNNIAST